MVTGDASYIKKINRALIIREIMKEGKISRADLSKITALTRATISAQVADLLEEELVVETELEHNPVGRKPIMLSLNAQAGYALGIDLDAGHATFLLSDLTGRPVTTEIIPIQSEAYEDIVQLLASAIRGYQSRCAGSRYGMVGIVLAVHGLVSNEQTIKFVPRFQWQDVDLKQDLERAVGATVHLENNANLSAFAERAYAHHTTDNLLCVTLYSGIGLGMIMDGKFFRGHEGFAGEIGHMIVVPGGEPCACGNRGCWEKYASETSVLRNILAAEPGDASDMEWISRLIAEGDEQVLDALNQFVYYLSIGLNNVINMYNPDVVVIDSELLRMVPDALQRIHHQLHSQISHYREITLSGMGRKSCVMGACALAISRFLDVPVLSLPSGDELAD